MKTSGNTRSPLRLAALVCLLAVLLPAASLADGASTSGNGRSTSYFWAVARSNASITFMQAKGTCTELSYTHLVDGVLGQEDEWGKYHVRVTEGSQSWQYEWDMTFNGSTFTVQLPFAGTWRVDVIPYTVSEMTDSWTLDTFVSWTAAPVWWISGTVNCDVTERNPRASVTKPPVTQPPHPVSGNIWDYPASGCALWLKDASVERIRPQCGPGSEYQVFASMNGSTRLYKPSHIDWMTAHFIHGSWVYVEFSYDGELRGGWFRQSLFNCSVPWTSIVSYDLKNGSHGTIRYHVTPYNGPGSNYGSYASCRLSAGESVYVLMQHNGWYYCRFNNNHSNCYGDIWLWVPADSVSLY